MFKKDDYIVILKEQSGSAVLRLNGVLKQRKDDKSPWPYKDFDGYHANGNTTLRFNDKEKWRYATQQEIDEYNRLGHPFISTFGQINNTYSLY